MELKQYGRQFRNIGQKLRYMCECDSHYLCMYTCCTAFKCTYMYTALRLCSFHVPVSPCSASLVSSLMSVCAFSPVSRGAGESAQGPAASLAVESCELAADGQVQAAAWYGGASGGHGGQGGCWQHGTRHCCRPPAGRVLQYYHRQVATLFICELQVYPHEKNISKSNLLPIGQVEFSSHELHVYT